MRNLLIRPGTAELPMVSPVSDALPSRTGARRLQPQAARAAEECSTSRNGISYFKL